MHLVCGLVGSGHIACLFLVRVHIECMSIPASDVPSPSLCSAYACTFQRVKNQVQQFELHKGNLGERLAVSLATRREDRIQVTNTPRLARGIVARVNRYRANDGLVPGPPLVTRQKQDEQRGASPAEWEDPEDQKEASPPRVKNLWSAQKAVGERRANAMRGRRGRKGGKGARAQPIPLVVTKPEVMN